MKIVHAKDYREARRAEYPDMGAQLDALWKALATMDLPPEAKAMLQQIQQVKAKYPK